MKQFASKERENPSGHLVKPIISVSSEVEYESEMSFFEEEEAHEDDSSDHEHGHGFS
jgi:hypothetical protein